METMGFVGMMVSDFRKEHEGTFLKAFEIIKKTDAGFADELAREWSAVVDDYRNSVEDGKQMFDGIRIAAKRAGLV